MTSPSAFLCSSPANQFFPSRAANICRRQSPQPRLHRSARVPRAAIDGVREQDVQHVDPATGRRQSPSAETAKVVELCADLPELYIDELGVESDRAATAVLFVRADVLASAGSGGAAPRAVIFLHGFSQRPLNYETTLRMLAAQGYVVIAPRVWLFDVAWPWVKIPGAAAEPGGRASQPAKLQTALLIDGFRCRSYVEKAFGVTSCALLGHSLGGAMALVAARAMRGETRLTSVTVLAPAVGPTVLTAVNEFLSLRDGGDLAHFAATFGDVPVMTLHGTRDLIVPSRDVRTLFDAITDERAADALALRGEIADAGHVGFEDSLDIDLPVLRILDVLLFKLIDAIVFGPFDVFVNNANQLEIAKELVRVWCEYAGGPGGSGNVKDAVDGLGIGNDKISYTWDGLQVPIAPSPVSPPADASGA